MKKVLLIVLMCAMFSGFAQDAEMQKYQRSSLTMILLQGTNYQEDKSKLDNNEVKIDNSPEAIQYLWDNYPFPDKYNEHDVGSVNINVVSNLTEKGILEARNSKNQKKDAEAIKNKIDNELKSKRVAHQIVKRWFSSEEGKFWDMSTIQDRGLYNATELEAGIAKADVRGIARLADAGEELINNSFVTVTDLLIYANKPIADLYRELATELKKEADKTTNDAKGKDNAAQLTASITAGALLTAASGFSIAAEAIKDGYTVLSKTFLYKLKWDNQIQGEFYNNWGNDAAFEEMDFELNFVGYQFNETVINRGVFNKKSNRMPEVVIKQAVVRNIDEAFAKLQEENDVFKPMVPVIGTAPITAQIGLKESITKKSKFNVLQKTEDPATGKTKWKKVGVASVAKIWDNRYYAGNANEKFDENGELITVEEAKGTTFKGGKDVVPGMMLKLIK